MDNKTVNDVPTPTDQLSRLRMLIQKLAPGFVETQQNMMNDPMGTMRRNVNRALPNSEELQYMITNHGNMEPSTKQKLMAIILKGK